VANFKTLVNNYFKNSKLHSYSQYTIISKDTVIFGALSFIYWHYYGAFINKVKHNLYISGVYIYKTPHLILEVGQGQHWNVA